MPSRTIDALETDLSGPELVENLPDSEILRLLGTPRTEAAVEMAARARAWYAANGRPWIRFREVSEAPYNSALLADRFRRAGAHGSVVVAASAGREIAAEASELWTKDRPDEAYGLDMFGAAVTEHLMRAASLKLCAWADSRSIGVLPRYSPGYEGWELRDQSVLYGLLAEGGPMALELLPSSMLAPKHSQLAVFGLTRRRNLVEGADHLIPCVTCALPACSYRRKPFKPVYGFPEKALARWRDQLLKVTATESGWRAQFRYQGSSCSNGGVSLAFMYDVEIGPEEEGYPIRKASCAPAGGDRGHRATCAWQEDPQGFLREVEPGPFVGRPLEETLSWNPQVTPAACLCTKSHRDHKWRMVFHTVHFALSRRSS